MPVEMNLIEELEKLKRQHHWNDWDNYYSCPKAPDGCDNEKEEKDKCNCGADKHNEQVDKIIAYVSANNLDREKQDE